MAYLFLHELGHVILYRADGLHVNLSAGPAAAAGLYVQVTEIQLLNLGAVIRAGPQQLINHDIGVAALARAELTANIFLPGGTGITASVPPDQRVMVRAWLRAEVFLSRDDATYAFIASDL